MAVPGPKAAPQGSTPETTARFQRNEGRAKLKQAGDYLQQTKLTASKLQKGARAPVKAKSTLANIAAKNGLPRKQPFFAFKVKGVKPVRGEAAKLASAPSRDYLTIGKPKSQRARYRVAVVAKEVGGRIIDYRIYHER